jgi:hypothetical protein
MIIGNYQEFINIFGNDNISQFNTLKNCISVLNKICSCQRQRKAIKAEECNILYINLVNSTVVNMIDYLKLKTSDSEIIFYHNGSHEIKRIKLR